ncbi:hypothetical protein [Arabiibacter massiliensis]|uniref:hypothetical protein n=1 Tax=Arabiibacter massiliensis TaxID=1870985 RepID=UPI00155A4547|nr:hypothetical protein [Arabiibacter massiliensis]
MKKAYTLVFVAFRNMNYGEMADAVKDLMKRAKGASYAFLVWFMGEPQAKMFAESKNGKSHDEPVPSGEEAESDRPSA